jgi:hypothetical protein
VNHQHYLGVRTPVIETGPPEWRSGARPSSYARKLGGLSWCRATLVCIYSADRSPEPNPKLVAGAGFAPASTGYEPVKETSPLPCVNCYRAFRLNGFVCVHPGITRKSGGGVAVSITMPEGTLGFQDQDRGRSAYPSVNFNWSSLGDSNTVPPGSEPDALLQ